MQKALDHNAGQTQKRTADHAATQLDWRKKMSDHVAFGLLVYTGLQIFITMTVLKGNHDTILPYFALVFLIVAIIPCCRWLEGQWSDLSDNEAADPALAPAFARDRMIIWVGAIGLPFALIGLFKVAALLFS